MEIKNSANIMFTKFNTIYKVLLYVFISISIVLALGTSIIVPAINKVFKSPESFQIFDNLGQTFASFINGSITMESLIETFKISYTEFMQIVATSKVPSTFWITYIVICVLIRFVTSRCYPVITDIFNNFMSSNMDYGFSSSLIKNFKQGMNYSANYTLITLPIDAIIVFIVLGLFKILFPLISMFALTLCLLFLVILISLRLTLFSGILPIMVVEGEKNFYKAFKKSLPMVNKYFKSYFSYLCVVIFAFYCSIMLFTFITFGIAFFVLVALLITFVKVMELTYYYGYNNMRYYIDANTIINTSPIVDRLDLQDDNNK